MLDRLLAKVAAAFARRESLDVWVRPYLRLPDGELALLLGKQLAGSQPLSFFFIEEIQQKLRENPERKTAFLQDMLDGYVDALSRITPPHDPSYAWLMGTTRRIYRPDWDARAAEIGYEHRGRTDPLIPEVAHFRHSGTYDVSVIVSLYRGARFIEHFLQNICSQSLMARSEIIIIDANSDQDEHDVIEKYQSVFDNIVYQRINYKISVYEAWNLAISQARGRYCTNANVDDLRRQDSLELQASALDREPSVDVVYQDVFYTLDPNMRFEDAEAFGFKSNLPLVTPHSLIQYNSPHNAPMWRRSIHDDVGMFDTSLRSAADWQFWLRCLLAGKRFRKLNAVHAAYHHNMSGISTNPDTAGVREGALILNDFMRKVTHPSLVSAYTIFAGQIGLPADPPSAEHLCDAPRYDAVQAQLLALTPTAATTSPQAESRPRPAPKTIKLLVDGIFFSLAKSGIARVWTVILQELRQREDLAICLLDRGSSPAIEGVETIEFPSHTFTNTAAESVLIEEVCRKVGADVFMSSYYTTPMSVPSVQLVYDMIPQIMGFDLRDRAWQEKALGLHFARRIVCISTQTRSDLLRFHPSLHADNVVVSHCGVDESLFRPRSSQEIDGLRTERGLKNPYFLLVGSRQQHKGYKNGRLAFEALKRWDGAAEVDLVCVGGEETVDPEWLEGLPPTTRVHRVGLNDDDLAIAYSGSLGLVFPSLYEGFGLPVVEAMACGCPVITTRGGALEEVAGDAATLVSGHDPVELRDAMARHFDSDVRAGARERGLRQARQFRWSPFVDRIADAVRQAREDGLQPSYRAFVEEWQRLRRIQADVDWRQILPG